MKPDSLWICVLTAAPEEVQTISETFPMIRALIGSFSYTDYLDKEQDEGEPFLSIGAINIFFLWSFLFSHKNSRN